MTNEPLHIPTGKYDWLSALHEVPKEQSTAIENRTLVIMMHDYPGGHKEAHGNLYGDIEYKLQKDGYDTLRFDFRGCGHSTGRSWDFTFQSARQDYKAIIEWAHKTGYESFIVIAEGFSACIAAMEQPEGLRGLILLWPMLDPKSAPLGSHIEEAANDDSEAAFITIGKTRVGKTFMKQLGECNMSSYIKAITIPILVQHGLKDETVPVTQLNMIRDNATSARRVEITTYEAGDYGLGHQNERAALLRAIGEFLKKYS